MLIQRCLAVLLAITRSTSCRIAACYQGFRSRFPTRTLCVFANTTPSYRVALMRGDGIADWYSSFHSSCLRVERLERQDAGGTLTVQLSEVGQ